jgi:hypothetical protein
VFGGALTWVGRLLMKHVISSISIYSLYVNLKKYAFATNYIKFLGFIVRTNSVTIDLSCVKAIIK